MGRLIVTSPAPGYTGDVGAVHFRDGVAEVDPVTHAAELAYMRNAGYQIDDPADAAPASDVEPDNGASDETSAPDADAAKPKKTAPVGDWRAYAVKQGLSVEEADGLTKNQLVERFDEEDNAS